MVNEQLDYIRKQYGKLVSQTNPEKDFEITAQFRNEEHEIEKISTFTLDDLKSKKAITSLKKETTNSVLNLPEKGLFKDNEVLKRALSLDDDQLKALSSSNITLELKEINERIPAESKSGTF